MTNPPIPLRPSPPDEPKCNAPGGRCIRGCRGSSMLGYRNEECPFPAPAEGEEDDEPTPLTDVPWGKLALIGGAAGAVIGLILLVVMSTLAK